MISKSKFKHFVQQKKQPFYFLVTTVQKLGNNCTTIPFKQKWENRYRGVMKEMKIVGQITTQEEANEIENITKNFIVGTRARELALQQKQ